MDVVDHLEQSDRLIKWLGDSLDSPGQLVRTTRAKLLPILGTSVPADLSYLINELGPAGIDPANLAPSRAAQGHAGR